MKRLNIKLLATLFVLFVGGSIGTFLLHGYQVRKTAFTRLEKAEAAEKDGDIVEEYKQLARYLQHVPEDTERYKRYLVCFKEAIFTGLTIPDKGEVSMLQRGLENLIRKHPNDVDLRRESVEFWLAAGQYSQALDHLEHLSSIEHTEANPWGALRPEDVRRWAGILSMQGDDAKGLKTIADSLAFDTETDTFDDSVEAFGKNDLGSYQLLASFYRRQMTASDSFAIPTAIMEKMVERNSDDVQAYISIAQYKKSIAKGADFQRAGIEDIEKALKIDANNADVIEAAADLYTQATEYEKARQLLARGLETYPDDRRMYRANARLYLSSSNSDPQNAIDVLGKGLARPELKLNDELLHDRALAYLELGNIAKAKEDFADMEKNRKRVQPHAVEVLRGRILMAERNYSDAVKVLERVQPMIANTSSTYRRSIARLLDEAYVNNNQGYKVQKNREDAGASTNEQQAKLERAQELVKRGDFNQALSLYRELGQEVERFREGAEGHAAFVREIMKVHIQLQQSLPEDKRDWTVVNNWAAKFLQAANLDPQEQVIFQVQVLSEQGKRREARRVAENARNQAPRNPNFWMLEVSLLNDNEQALNLLNRMEQTIGDTSFCRRAKAERIAQINAPDAVQKLEALVDNTGEFPAGETRDLKMTIANQLAGIKAYDSAFRIFDELLAEGNVQIPLITNVFDVAIQAGNVQKMDAMLDRFDKLVGRESAEYLVHSSRKTIWEITNGADVSAIDEIQARLATAESREPNWHLVHAVKADALVLQNKKTEAIDSLKLAYDQDSRPTYAQKLSKLALDLGRLAESREWLNKLPEGAKSTADIRNDILIQARNPDPNERQNALQRATEVVDSSTTNPDELIFLGEVFDAVGDKKNAMTAFKRAVDAAPNNPSPWLRYVTHARLTSDWAAGEEAIKNIQLTSMDPAAMELLLGQCNTLMNHMDAAKVHYRKASELAPDNSIVMRNIVQLTAQDGDTPMRDEFLDKLLALTPNTNEDKNNIQWARQAKAKLLAASKTYPEFQKAVALIDQNRNSFGKLSEGDLLVWLQLHAERPEPDSRRKATAKLDEIRRERLLNPFERYMLATIQKANGDWTEAKSTMQALLADQPDNPTVITPLVEWLMERGDNYSLTEAGQLLSRLSDNNPDKLRLTCIVLVKQGRAKDAYDRLMTLVPKNLPEERSKTIREVARMFSVLGEFEPKFYGNSDQLWQRYLKLLDKDQQAAEFPMYVASLMSVPDSEESKGANLKKAFTRCNAFVKSDIGKQEWSRVLTYISLAVDGIRTHKDFAAPDSPYFKATQSWIDAVRAANFSPEDVLIQQAFLADLQQDHASVEKAYREFLQLPSANAYNKGVVRNNLAYHLAITGKGSEALEVISEAISSLGERNDLRDTRAMAYIDLKEYDKAIADLDAIERDGEASPSTYFHRAFAKMKNSDRDGAAADMNRAVELGLKKEDLGPIEVKLYDEAISSLDISVPSENAISAG
ncbi:MAG: tetratricopeptide repeat protein [Planctomycetales bacterium]|nr:tetratricopeptide repeat protein [Planctomycetales bacterium]